MGQHTAEENTIAIFESKGATGHNKRAGTIGQHTTEENTIANFEFKGTRGHIKRDGKHMRQIFNPFTLVRATSNSNPHIGENTRSKGRKRKL